MLNLLKNHPVITIISVCVIGFGIWNHGVTILGIYTHTPYSFTKWDVLYMGLLGFILGMLAFWLPNKKPANKIVQESTSNER